MLYSIIAGIVLHCLCLGIPYYFYKKMNRNKFINTFGDHSLDLANPHKFASMSTILVAVIATAFIQVPYTITNPELNAPLSLTYLFVGIFYIAYLTILLSKK